jgi:hypothetical protein
MQTSYASSVPRGFAGMLADGSDYAARSYVNAQAAALPFGVAVVNDSSARGVVLPTAADQVFAGVVMHSHDYDNRDLSGALGVPDARMCSVLRKGIIFVLVEEAVSKGDKVFTRIANGVADDTKVQKGAFRKSPDSGTAILLPGAEYLAAASAGALVEVEINLGNLGDSSVAITVDNGSATDDVTLLAFTTPANRNFLIEAVTYRNPTGLAANASNFFALKVLNAATQAAIWSTETGQQGTLTAGTAHSLVLGTAAQRLVPPSTSVTILLDETGTATLPAGQFTIHGRYC